MCAGPRPMHLWCKARSVLALKSLRPPEGQHDDIQHEVLLVALFSGRDGCAFREGRLRWIKSNKRLVAPNWRGPRCHVAHAFSRWVLRQRYRKVIKSVGRF